MKTTFTYLFIFCTVMCFSQKDFYGKATYQTKTTFDADRFNNREMSEERKKRMLEAMKGMLEKTYTLNFNKTASVYKEVEKLDTPSAGGRRGLRFNSLSVGDQYKNVADKVFLEEKEFFGKKFLISDDASMPQWEMSGETKKIGNYVCYKATMLKKNNAFDWNRRRGKEDSDEKQAQEPKEELVTAWYAIQIPVSSGPAGYWGLPGLILEINSGRTTILCTEVVLNPKERITIKEPKKGEKVTREEYNDIMKKKMAEMREMWRGRRRRG